MEQLWKRYRRRGVTEMRPYIPGENLAGISVSQADDQLPTLEGGMIARNPDNHADQWYVNAAYVAANMVEVSGEEG